MARKQMICHNYTLVVHFLYFLWMLLMLVDFVLAVRNEEWTLSSATILISYYEMITKFVIFRKNKVPQFFGHVKRYEREIKSSNNPRIIKSYREHAFFCNKINWGTMVITNMVVCSFVIGGITEDIKSKEFSKDENCRPYNMMYHFWLPFGVRDKEPVILIINVLITTSGMVLYNSILMILGAWFEFLVSQMRVLQITFSAITNGYGHSDMNQYLKELIVEHKYIIRLIQKFSHLVRYVILMKYLLNAIAVAAVAVQLLLVKNPEGSMFLASFVCTLYSHILLRPHSQ
ncbi:hypothetical protein GWI33_015008 [Rhynchophorus ferrugineus]|uniref:Odorant receptor n=1 Tax=Rhynchophorus ferrugineus TaxID=354439 RepID=A0A834M8J0_RHYFE|nr:hypothetical protein GWI33_015008 [Rhynchophorus ferrugineus]